MHSHDVVRLQHMRDAAIRMMRSIGTFAGGCNVQFAMNPEDGRMIAIELKQGVRLWDIDVGGIQMPWLAGDFLYVLTNDSQVVCSLVTADAC